MRWLTVIALLFLTSCVPHVQYDIPLDSPVVTLYLDEHKLEGIPDDIGEFSKAELVRIRHNRSGKWMIFPPNSYYQEDNNPLTSGICGLANVRELDLSMQMLTSLPPCFGELKALERLDVTHNFLDLGKEWQKLKQLPALKVIYIDGNTFNKDSISGWNKDRPDIAFVYDPDRPSTAEEHQALVTVNTLIYSYYTTMSARNWNEYREYFWDDATLTTIWQMPGESEPAVHVATINEFIAGTADGPDSQPIFEEKPLGIEIRINGNLAVAWVDYEARFGSEDALMEWTGTDVFTLMEHNGEWKITALAYAGDN